MYIYLMAQNKTSGQIVWFIVYFLWMLTVFLKIYLGTPKSTGETGEKSTQVEETT